METNNNSTKSVAAEREEAILAFWKEHDVFQKSLTKDAPRGNYVFYDGPPFATGLPHYGHILGSTAKDVIGRYQTMRGFRVPRRWGWDCHGLPIENIVEKDLGISGHVEIEQLGVEKFVEHARSKVLTYVGEWKKTVDRIGRWVDFDGGYKTMDTTFIESVWWALGQLHTKGLIYEGVRVLAYCPRCETPIAKSEIAMDNSYKDIADISVYVKFALVDEPGTHLVAWTTTPWSLPGNTAIAINGEALYVKAKIENEYFVVAKDRAEAVFKDKQYEIVEEFPGAKLVGKKYIPPFNYYANDEKILTNPKAWTVIAADFVTTTDGTGIAHEAPAFGEDDANLAKKEGLPFLIHVTPEGKFADAVTDFAGMPIKPKSAEKDGHMAADIQIIKYLAANGLLFKKEKIMHAYPHCYRCDTPLFYYALPSWFVNVQNIKPHMLETAQSMEWIPTHLKDGRFNNTMEGAPDWTISRNRYWASPLPIWKSATGKLLFVDSIADLKAKTKKSGNRYFAMRHGYGQHMDVGVVSGLDHDSYHLTEDGKKGIFAQAETLKKDGITKIIVSPLIRTQETAKIAAGILGISESDIITDARLREYDFGEWDGKPWQEYVEYRKTHIVEYDTKLGASSLLETKQRFGDFMYDIESNYQNENILIVTHGIFFETVAAVVEGADNARSLEILFAEFTGHRIQPAEIREIPFVPLPHNARYEIDLHRPYIDAIKLTDEHGEVYERIPEVIDCWFESGSMPFAQDHYPFSNQSWKENNFPAGFVAEYIAQTRTWFYYSHVISTILFGHAPFEHVVTTGTVLAEDGQKMSKSKNNFPDPWILFNKYGVDSLRFYLMSSPLMKGEDVNFSEKTVQEIANKIIGRLQNVVSFYELYRDTELETRVATPSQNVLDIWITSRLSQVANEVTHGMEAYDMAEATRPIELFVDDLSTWYLRRSRDRIKDGDQEAKQTLYVVLKTMAQLLAPFTPFTAEDIWQRLKTANDAESVHLTTWPEMEFVAVDDVLVSMQTTRALCASGHMLRQKSGIPVRQPLATFFMPDTLGATYQEIIKDELNVKALAEGPETTFDTVITPELKLEGDYRELVREVQDLRKKEGLTPSDQITIVLPKTNEVMVTTFMDDFKKTVQAEQVSFEEVGEINLKKV